MEPKLPASNLGPERSPINFGQNFEHAPLSLNPETSIERHSERIEQRNEVVPAVETAVPILPPPIVVTPSSPVVDNTSSTPVATTAPLVANDDDLIEKEWVDQAKKIIVQTKDDPYRREQEVSKLQADYLRKRYGRELGTQS